MVLTKSFSEIDSERAREIANSGFVNRDRDRFLVTVPKRLGGPATYEVKRDREGLIRCDCTSFALAGDPDFRCEHMIAVRLAVLARNTEPGARKTESGDATDNENSQRLAEPEAAGRTSNILRFSGVHGIHQEPGSVRTDAVPAAEDLQSPTTTTGGAPMTPDWERVADILDANSPHWSYSVREVRRIAGSVAVTAAVTVDGVTRESVGICPELAGDPVRAAECDAFARAALKFGFVRDGISAAVEPSLRGSGPNGSVFPSDPVARSIADLVSGRQLGMIRGLCRQAGADQEAECRAVMHCSPSELSKRAASAFIDYLQNRVTAARAGGESQMRRAG